MRRKNLWLGIPAVMLSTVVGTSLFASLADPEAGIPPAFKIAIGSISVTAAILSALQTFLRFGERAEQHGIAAESYAGVRRDIEQLLALSAKDRGTPKTCFDRIRKQMSKVGQHSPKIGDRLWKDMATRYHVRDLRPPLPTPARTTQSPADSSDATVPIAQRG